MTFRFIGTNDSIGLVNGKLYHLALRTMGRTDGLEFLWVRVYDCGKYLGDCTYLSFKAFTNNWEAV